MNRSALMAAMVALLVALAGCGRSADDLRARGEEKLRRGDLPGAIVDLKGAVLTAPEDPNLRYLLGRAHNGAYDGASAEKEFARARELGFDEGGRVSAGLARALWLQGKHQAIVQQGVPSANIDETVRAEILAYQGHAFAAMGKRDEALARLRASREAGVDRATAPIVPLLEANIAAGDRDPARALVVIDRVLKQHPGNYDALALRAEIVRLTGSPEASVAAYGDLLKVHPTHITALVGRSTLLVNLGRLDEAGKDIERLQAAYKDHYIAFFQEGLLKLRKGEAGAALEAFQRALKRNPEFEQGRLYEGIAQLLVGNQESAQRSLTQYVTQRPSDPLGRRMLAKSLLLANETARALEVMAPVLEREPVLPEFADLAAEAYVRQGDLDKAADWLARAEKAAPEDPAIQEKQGDINLRRRRADLALGDFADAARLSKTLSRADAMLVLVNMFSGDYDRARDGVEAMERKSPGNVLVANLRGMVLLERGQQEEARAAFESALAKQPTFLPAAANLARLDLLQGKPEQVRKRFDAILAADKNHLQALLVIAEFDARLGRPGDAVAALERALRAHPLALEPRRRLVDLLLAQGRRADARSRAEEGVKLDPRRPAMFELLAAVRLAEGDRQGAVEALGRIVELEPRAPGPLVARARVERLAGMNKEAEQSLLRALEIQRDFGPAHSTLFELLVQANRVQQAAELVRRLKSDFPRFPLGSILEAELFARQRQYKDAARSYANALELSRSGEVAARLYQIRVQAGEGAAALEALRRWVGEHPDQHPARLELSQALLDRGDFAEAVRECQAVLRSAPTHVVAMNNMALGYLGMGDRPRAVRHARIAHRLLPNDPYVADTLGWILLADGKAAEARALLEKAASALKSRPDVRYHYAVALAQLGERDKARIEVAQALALGSFRERMQAVELANQLGR